MCVMIARSVYFGLVLSLRRIHLLAGEQLPDASSVVLVSQGVQEHVEGGRRLCQDGSDHFYFGGDQVGVLDSSIEGQHSVGTPTEQQGLEWSASIEPGVSGLLESPADGLVGGHDNDHGDDAVADGHGDQVRHVVPVSLADVQSTAGPERLVVILSPANDGHISPECSEQPDERSQSDGTAPLQLCPSAVLVVSIPCDSSDEVEASESCEETLESVQLASI